MSRTPAIAICRYCDTVHRRTAPVGRARARCVACDAVLYAGDGEVGAMLAIALTGAIAFVVANAFPLVTIATDGQPLEVSIGHAIAVANDRGLVLVALALFVTLVAAPALELALLLWVLVPLCLRARPPGFAVVMRLLYVLRPWRMLEVFLLGIGVAIVKLGGVTRVEAGAGVLGIVVLALALAALAAFDRGALWRRVGSSA